MKFDGYRMLCRIDRGRVTLWSRNGKGWTEKFLNGVEAVKSLKLTSAILDGEIVIVDAQGITSFQKLKRAINKDTTSGFVYEVFDLIYVDGFNLNPGVVEGSEGCLERSEPSSNSMIRYSEYFQGNGEAFFKHACEYGILGIVSNNSTDPHAMTCRSRLCRRTSV